MRIIASHLLVLVLIPFASAQDADLVIPRTILKNSPQHFMHKTLKIGMEHFNSRYTKSFSFLIIVKGDNIGNRVFGYDGVGGELQYRRYISPMQEVSTLRNKKFYRGVYIGGFVQGGVYRGKFESHSSTGFAQDYDFSEDILNGAAGFVLGYQRTLWQVIYVDAYIGGGMASSHSRLSGGAIPDWAFQRYADPGAVNYSGIFPKYGLLLGIPL